MSCPEERSFRCEVLSWSRVAGDTKRLARVINASGYKPDIVVAIGRGGYVPARILCDYLMMKDLTTIKVEHWGIAATPDEKAVIKYPLCADIKKKRVLLVDDITDTGDTLRISMEYLRGFNPDELKTAVLIHKTTSRIIPDYYVRKVVRWRWIIFPWHIREDLSGFIREISEAGIHSAEEITLEIKRRYGLNINADVVNEILSEL